jgi:hypothetical protein
MQGRRGLGAGERLAKESSDKLCNLVSTPTLENGSYSGLFPPRKCLGITVRLIP